MHLKHVAVHQWWKKYSDPLFELKFHNVKILCYKEKCCIQILLKGTLCFKIHNRRNIFFHTLVIFKILVYFASIGDYVVKKKHKKIHIYNFNLVQMQKVHI